MAYDIFSQPLGPNINESLLVDSADKGYRTGQQLGGVTSNIIEGAISGYRQGQAIYTESQQQQIRQNQIDQLPVENEYRQEQLEALKRKNDIDALEQEFQVNNRKLIEKAKLQELQAKARESQQAVEDSDNADQIMDAIASNDPLALRIAANNPSFGGTFVRNPKLFEQVIGAGSAVGAFDPSEQEKLRMKLDYSREIDRQRKEQDDRQKATERAQTELPVQTAALGVQPDFALLQGVRPDITPERAIAEGKVVAVPRPTGSYQKSSLTGKTEFRPFTTEELAAQARLPREYKFMIGDKEVENFQPSKDFVEAFGKAKTNYTLLNPSSTPAPAPAAPEQDKSGYLPGDEEWLRRHSVPNEQRAIQRREQFRKRREEAQQQEPRAMLRQDFQVGVAEFVDRTVSIGGQAHVVPKEVASKPEFLQAVYLAPAVTNVESGGKQSAVSPKGATGLMQLMPGTFKDVVRRYNLKDYDINNPQNNVEVGSLYLAEQIKRFGNQFGSGLELALAAYNTGPGRVADALRNADEKSWDGVKAELKKMLNPRAYKEVSEYPDKVRGALLALNNQDVPFYTNRQSEKSYDHLQRDFDEVRLGTDARQYDAEKIRIGERLPRRYKNQNVFEQSVRVGGEPVQRELPEGKTEIRRVPNDYAKPKSKSPIITK